VCGGGGAAAGRQAIGDGWGGQRLAVARGAGREARTVSAAPPAPLLACSRVSTPVKRKTNRDYRDYGNGQINAYPPPAPGMSAAGNAVMMSLAEELLTKKGLSLKVRPAPSGHALGWLAGWLAC